MKLIEKKSHPKSDCYIGLTRGNGAILTENKVTEQMQTFCSNNYEENAFFTLRGVRQVEQRLDKDYLSKFDCNGL